MTEVLAVAEGPDGLFATAHPGDAHPGAAVSVWSGPGRLRTTFQALPAQPFGLAFGVAGDDRQIVIGAWNEGVAGYQLDGAQIWHRRDIKHVQRVRTVAGGRVGIVCERGPGLILGPTGGTRWRIGRAKFLAGAPDGGLVVHRGEGLERLTAPDGPAVWQIPLGSFAVLDASVDSETIVVGADGQARLIDAEGNQRWKTPRAWHQMLRVHADRAGPGWLCLRVPFGEVGPSQLLRLSPDGDVEPVLDFPGDPVDFVNGGRHVILTDGTIVDLPR